MEIRFFFFFYFLYIVYLTKIAKIHIFQHLPIWPEVAGIMIFHQKWVLWVYLRLLQTILQERISWRFSYLWKKSIFSSSKFGQKNENRKFYREFVLESSDCFARGYFSIVPPLESTFPPLLPILYTWLWNFFKSLLKFQFLVILRYKLKFPRLLPEIIFIQKVCILSFRTSFYLKNSLRYVHLKSCSETCARFKFWLRFILCHLE